MKQAHVIYLECRHKALEAEIAEALLHSSTDDFEIVDLKRSKLHLEDEIEQVHDEARKQRALG